MTRKLNRTRAFLDAEPCLILFVGRTYLFCLHRIGVVTTSALVVEGIANSKCVEIASFMRCRWPAHSQSKLIIVDIKQPATRKLQPWLPSRQDRISAIAQLETK